MGCRIYFCDPAYQETGNQITEKYLRKIKDLASAHDLGWQYAPLHYFLNNAPGQPSTGAVETQSRAGARIPLAVVSASSSRTNSEE
jgi:hypothetical protein